jgi:hypothetical protein
MQPLPKWSDQSLPVKIAVIASLARLAAILGITALLLLAAVTEWPNLNHWVA